MRLTFNQVVSAIIDIFFTILLIVSVISEKVPRFNHIFFWFGLIIGILYVTTRFIDFEILDRFEVYFLLLSIFIVVVIMTLSLFVPFLLSNNMVNSIIIYVASFSTFKSILKFLYQTYVHRHKKS